MRKIERTGQFKRDFKRELKGRHGKSLNELLTVVVTLLVTDTPMPERLFDHALTGNWADHRDCHIKPDLILIYRRPDPETIQLVRLGSHSELGIG